MRLDFKWKFNRFKLNNYIFFHQTHFICFFLLYKEYGILKYVKLYKILIIFYIFTKKPNIRK